MINTVRWLWCFCLHLISVYTACEMLMAIRQGIIIGTICDIHWYKKILSLYLLIKQLNESHSWENLHMREYILYRSIESLKFLYPNFWRATNCWKTTTVISILHYTSSLSLTHTCWDQLISAGSFCIPFHLSGVLVNLEDYTVH